MATIYDVAKRAGVSKTLVSRVLNHQPGVSPQSREKICQAMEELQYRPNALARSLVLQKTFTIGVVFDSLSDAYFFDVINGIEDEGAKQKYKVIFSSARNREVKKEQYIEFFSNGNTDGVIIYGSNLDDEDLMRRRAQMKFPFVVIENEIENVNINSVIVDNIYGSKMAVDHLTGLGCKKIMHVTGDKFVKASLKRWQGYLDAMKAHQLQDYISVIECEKFGIEAGYKAIKTWLESHTRSQLPEAIYFGADNTAFGGMMALEDAGIRIPEDIRIVGFDDDRPWQVGRKLKQLTSLRQPLYEMGQKSVQLLVHQIDHPEAEKQTIIMRPELIVRETT